MDEIECPKHLTEFKSILEKELANAKAERAKYKRLYAVQTSVLCGYDLLDRENYCRINFFFPSQDKRYHCNIRCGADIFTKKERYSEFPLYALKTALNRLEIDLGGG
jgi:hypothetical protein